MEDKWVSTSWKIEGVWLFEPGKIIQVKQCTEASMSVVIHFERYEGKKDWNYDIVMSNHCNDRLPKKQGQWRMAVEKLKWGLCGSLNNDAGPLIMWGENWGRVSSSFASLCVLPFCIISAGCTIQYITTILSLVTSPSPSVCREIDHYLCHIRSCYMVSALDDLDHVSLVGDIWRHLCVQFLGYTCQR